MGKARRYDVSFIRALAILLVMLGHSIIIYSSGWNLYSTDVSAPLFDHLKDMINVVQMPLFFSVSGFCLVYTVGPVGCRPVGLGVKARRLLIPFLVVGLLWMLPIRLAVGYPGYTGGGSCMLSFLTCCLGLTMGTCGSCPLSSSCSCSYECSSFSSRRFVEEGSLATVSSR